jgi:hypothetical protein
MEFALFDILHNVIKIKNNSSEPPHHYKQNLVSSFHIMKTKHKRIEIFHGRYE